MFLILRRALYIFLLLSCIALISLILLFRNFIHSPLVPVKTDILNVPPGSSINSVATTLHSKGYLRSPSLFIYYARWQGKEKSLKAGEYQLEVGITPKKLLEKLVQGKVIMRQFTIVEGWTLKQVFNSIYANPYLTHTIHFLSAPDFSKKIGIQQGNLEGYFYPDTYSFAAGVPDVVILKKAFWVMQRNLNSLWQNRDAGLPYNDPYSALIVASLIERETAKPEERTKIAGVIVRRLQQNMLLQIDASVIYGLGDTYTGKLTREDLKKDNPYNTYLHKGLPPTPIAMPSVASIYAALHPERSDALYYVARGDGSHVFTANLQKHHEAVRKYHVEHLVNDATFPPFEIIPWFNQLTPSQLNSVFGLIPFKGE